MAGNETSASSTFVVLLALLFIGLKLARVITWPWVWVLAPLWISAIVALVAVVVALLMFWPRKRR